MVTDLVVTAVCLYAFVRLSRFPLKNNVHFFFVEVHAAYGLLIVTTGFSLIVFLKTGNKGSRTFLIAVAVSSLSALVFMNEWGISRWFNHFDISHILMAISAWFFYKGSLLMIKDPLAIPEEKN